MLEYMLETDLVNCVIIVTVENEFPTVKIIRETKEISQGMQSKYGYVPLGVAWTELRRTKETFAFVGLPCHISGFNKTAEVYKTLQEQCKLKIGLFCGYTQKYDNIETFKKTANSLDGKFHGWREGAYPGGVHIKEASQEKLIPLQKWLPLAVPFFTMKRCLLCEDGVAEEADIVLGDSHHDGDDLNVILVRNHHGEMILHEAQRSGYIQFEKISKEKADSGTIGWVPIAKGCYPQIFNRFLRLIGKKTPNFHRKRPCSFKTLIIGFFKTSLLLLSNKYYMKWFGHSRYTGAIGWIIYNFPGSIKPTKKNWNAIKSIYKDPYSDYRKE